MYQDSLWVHTRYTLSYTEPLLSSWYDISERLEHVLVVHPLSMLLFIEANSNKEIYNLLNTVHIGLAQQY